MIQLLAIHPNRVWEQWGLFGEFVDSVIARHPAKFTERMIGDLVAGEKWQLWIAWDAERCESIACGCTEILEGQDGKDYLNVLFLTGRQVRRWLHLIDEINEWAKRQGAVRFEGMTRPGWERLLRDRGYRKTHVILEKDL